MTAWTTRVWLAVVVTAATLFVLATYWPGYMTLDSIQQLLEGRRGQIGDLHPPIMARVWGAIDARWRGPSGMVALHNLLFWTGAALVVLRSCRRGRRTVALLLLALYPPVLALLGTVWKDVGLGAALTFTVGLMTLTPRTRAGRGVRGVGIGVALVYACAVRHNGLAAIVPLVFSFAHEQWAGRRTRWIPAGVLGVVAVYGLAAGVNAWARTTPHGYPAQMILYYDLVGISRAAGELLLPERYRRDPWTFEAVTSRYTPEGAERLFVVNPGALPISADPADFAALVATWRDIVRSHPMAYLRHRARVMWTLLFGRLDGTSCVPFARGVRSHPDLRIAYEPTPLNRRVMPVLEAIKDTLFFRPWAHVLLAATLAVVAWRRRRPLAAAVAASGLLYVAAYFPVGLSCGFRMAWWLVIAAPLAALLLGATPGGDDTADRAAGAA